jgi:hypothetical protein
LTGRKLSLFIGSSLAAYFYFCFWNYALAVDVMPLYFGGRYPHGLFDSPLLFGYLFLHSSLGESPQYLLGQLGTLSLLMAAVCLSLMFLSPPMRGFKVFLFSLCAMMFSWFQGLSIWIPSTLNVHFADWTTSAGLAWITNTDIGTWSLLLMVSMVGWEVWKRASVPFDMWKRRKLPPLPPLSSYAMKLLSDED